MYRGFCLVLIVALALCGCPKKGSPPETQTVEVQPPPEAPADGNALPPPSAPEHPVIATMRQFINAIAAGNYNRALSLTVPGEITEQSLKGMHEPFQWDQATFTQAWADAEQAAVVSSVPVKQGSATLTLAFNLMAAKDGRWLVRQADWLTTPQDVNDYLAAFHDVAPDAKSIEPQN
jgi:hypothetical protein